VDPQTVDQNYAQLQQQGQQTAALIQALAGKLQAAAAAGDMNAREWMLDLKEVTLGVQQEEGQVSLLLQSIHSMVDNHVQSTGQPGYQQQGYEPPQPGYQQQGYQQPQYQQQGGMMGGGGGGMLQSFLGGGFGRAIVTGAGFGIGDDIINKIF
jgi:outer membrane lipoprotein SlyB